MNETIDVLMALRWCIAELEMRCDLRIPSVKQAVDAARLAIKQIEARASSGKGSHE